MNRDHPPTSQESDASSLNPYAPPQTESFREVATLSLESLKGATPIRFHGAPTKQELNRYLQSDSHVSVGSLIVLGVGASIILLPTLTAAAYVGSFSTMAIVFGLWGLVISILFVSTMPYRRSVFRNLNPSFDESIRGELSHDGVQIEREFASASFRWDWFCGVVVSSDVIAFLPATRTGQPLFVTRGMLEHPQDWNRLNQFAEVIGIVSDTAPIDQLRSQQNHREMRQRDRRPTVQPPEDAIVFSGAVTTADLMLVPKSQRLLRSRVLGISLFLFSVISLAGLSQAIFQQFFWLPGLLAAYMVAGILYGKRRRKRAGNRPIYFMHAFATDAFLFLDLGITTAKIEWNGLRLARESEESFVFRRCHWLQFIVAREDMFSDSHQWQSFRRLVKQRAAPTTTRS